MYNKSNLVLNYFLKYPIIVSIFPFAENFIKQEPKYECANICNRE